MTRLRDRFGLSDRGQRRLTRVMQVALVGLFAIGLERRDPGIVVNAAVALGVTYLPAVLERDYEIPMDAGLTLWVTSAVFLHALGTVGVPGGEDFYGNVGWWDHVTHALSSSVVAAVGYTVVRAVDEHTDAISLTPRFTFLFILLFVVAFGVVWEVIEFVVGQFGFLTQYGLRDTLWDLVFDLVGGLVVALWGTAHLADVAGAVARRLDGRAGG